MCVKDQEMDGWFGMNYQRAFVINVQIDTKNN